MELAYVDWLPRDIEKASHTVPNLFRLLSHYAAILMTDSKLFLAPLDTNKSLKVLDLGTGTGHWAM
jgi:hypothetical protein